MAKHYHRAFLAWRAKVDSFGKLPTADAEEDLVNLTIELELLGSQLQPGLRGIAEGANSWPEPAQAEPLYANLVTTKPVG